MYCTVESVLHCSFPDSNHSLNKSFKMIGKYCSGIINIIQWFYRSLRAKPASGAPLLKKFGSASMPKILVVTSAYVRPSLRPSVRTDSGGGGGKSQGNPTGSGECHLFLAGNRAVLLGNRRFSWWEIA